MFERGGGDRSSGCGSAKRCATSSASASRRRSAAARCSSTKSWARTCASRETIALGEGEGRSFLRHHRSRTRPSAGPPSTSRSYRAYQAGLITEETANLYATNKAQDDPLHRRREKDSAASTDDAPDGPASSISMRPRRTPTSACAIGSLMSAISSMEFQNRLDLFEPGDQTALVCVDVPEVQRIVVDQLTALGLQDPHRPFSRGHPAEAAHARLRRGRHLRAFQRQRHRARIRSSPKPCTRRPSSAASSSSSSLGSSFTTNDEMQAFQHSVDLVVSLADVVNLRPVLRRGLAAHAANFTRRFTKRWHAATARPELTPAERA